MPEYPQGPSSRFAGWRLFGYSGAPFAAPPFKARAGNEVSPFCSIFQFGRFASFQL
jgi:hypothetical protein